MEILIGSDHGGYKLKQEIIKYLNELGHTVEDCGCYSEESCDYPDIAQDVAKKVLLKGKRAILVCGTGTGMSVVANKFKGVYAALCRNYTDAKYSRAINNANVLCMGGWITGKDAGVAITDVFLETEFTQDLEDWRAANLKKAYAGIQEMENEIYR